MNMKEISSEEARLQILALLTPTPEYQALKELTRWIPTSERMPTEADGPVIRCFDKYTRLREFPATFINGVLKEYAYDSCKGVMRWQEVSAYEFAYWQRGTSPEGE